MTHQRKPLTATERAEILASLRTEDSNAASSAKGQARALRMYRERNYLSPTRRKESLERERELLQRALALQTKSSAVHKPGLTRR